MVGSSEAGGENCFLPIDFIEEPKRIVFQGIIKSLSGDKGMKIKKVFLLFCMFLVVFPDFCKRGRGFCYCI